MGGVCVGMFGVNVRPVVCACVRAECRIMVGVHCQIYCRLIEHICSLDYTETVTFFSPVI